MPRTLMAFLMTILITTATIAVITRVRPLARFAGMTPADNAVG